MRAAVESAITANFIISPFGRAPATNELKPQPFHECLFIIARSGSSPLSSGPHGSCPWGWCSRSKSPAKRART
jgi:hypothetical protein